MPKIEKIDVYLTRPVVEMNEKFLIVKEDEMELRKMLKHLSHPTKKFEAYGKLNKVRSDSPGLARILWTSEDTLGLM